MQSGIRLDEDQWEQFRMNHRGQRGGCHYYPNRSLVSVGNRPADNPSNGDRPKLRVVVYHHRLAQAKLESRLPIRRPTISPPPGEDGG